jgi:hypothetical protein
MFYLGFVVGIFAPTTPKTLLQSPYKTEKRGFNTKIAKNACVFGRCHYNQPCLGL